MSSSGKDVSVTELSSQTGLPPSHVCRLLKTLLEAGYVEQDAGTRRYRVSLKLLNLAHARLASLDFRRIGHPFAVRLAQTLQAQTFLAQPLRGRSILVHVAEPPGMSSGDPALVVGRIHPVHRSACGRVCAAFATETEREELLATVAQEHPGLACEVWMDECARVRAARFAVRDEPGVLAAAAPLFRAEGQFCGALGVLLPQGTALSPSIEQEIRRTAEALSFALGYPFAQ